MALRGCVCVQPTLTSQKVDPERQPNSGASSQRSNVACQIDNRPPVATSIPL